tara:strand:- start:305 stop:1105 length:801 start_codon:yes stop_codon:yes gene_type:complete
MSLYDRNEDVHMGPGVECHSELGYLKAKYQIIQNPNYTYIEPLGRPPGVGYGIPSTSKYFPLVYVVSPGASGSSCLYKALEATQNKKFPIIKSHSYPTKWRGRNCLKYCVKGGRMWELKPLDKIIYLFAHPLSIVNSFYVKISADREAWSEGTPHYVDYLECDVEESFLNMFMDKDVLQLGKHLRKWWRPQSADIMCIKYEKLFDYKDEIENFISAGRVEYTFTLPPWRKRNTHWKNNPEAPKLVQTYAPLVEEYEKKPDYEIFHS